MTDSKSSVPSNDLIDANTTSEIVVSPTLPSSSSPIPQSGFHVLKKHVFGHSSLLSMASKSPSQISKEVADICESSYVSAVANQEFKQQMDTLELNQRQMAELQEQLVKYKINILIDIKTCRSIDAIFAIYSIENTNKEHYSSVENQQVELFDMAIGKLRQIKDQYDEIRSNAAERVKLLKEFVYYADKCLGMKKDREKRASQRRSEDPNDVKKWERNQYKLSYAKKQYEEIHKKILDLIVAYLDLLKTSLPAINDDVWSQELLVIKELQKCIGRRSKKNEKQVTWNEFDSVREIGARGSKENQDDEKQTT